jgi:hypothetical protein
MPLANGAHHRVDSPRGDSARQRFAYRRALLCAAVTALDALLSCDLECTSIRTKAVILRARVARDRAWPLVTDEDGRAWE